MYKDDIGLKLHIVRNKVLIKLFQKFVGFKGTTSLVDDRSRRNTQDFQGVPLLVLFYSIKEKRTTISLHLLNLIQSIPHLYYITIL